MSDVLQMTHTSHDDFGVDRLDRLELMILIEDKFVGAEFTDNDADQMELVSDLIRHIECSSSQHGHRAVKKRFL